MQPGLVWLIKEKDFRWNQISRAVARVWVVESD